MPEGNSGFRAFRRDVGTQFTSQLPDGFSCVTTITMAFLMNGYSVRYVPIEYEFHQGEMFKHSDIKWVDYEDTLSAKPVSDRALDAELRDISARLFTRLKGASFGRCDIRVDRDGTPFMLEINSNCGIYFPEADYGGADLCLANDPAGHEGFTRQIIDAALARHARQRRQRKAGRGRRKTRAA